MQIENSVYRIKVERQGSWLEIISTALVGRLGENTYPLRFTIVDIVDQEIVIEATNVRFDADDKYAEALSKLINDILPKTNGCVSTGAPDKNDWITDCAAQAEVYPYLIEVKRLLELMLQ